jgi:hypothetical protein
MYVKKLNTMCWCEYAWAGRPGNGQMGKEELAIRVVWTAEVLTLPTRREFGSNIRIYMFHMINYPSISR